MAIDLKYGHVTLEHGAHIPDDEPVVVFRAKHKLLPDLLIKYMVLCHQAGSPDRHLELIAATLDSVEEYQRQHPPVTPTSETSRAWMP